jgi:cytoskeletal protein CcmA (bactofilin family)
MFGKAKGSSHEKDKQLPPAPQLQESASANLAESDSTEISCIGPGMTVVGKISGEGLLNVLGRVEGELHASIVRISDGAQVEGTIAAQELTIGGRFKGTIQADRVTLTSSAVVEGEIHHRSLAIEGNAWFAGASRPKKASASEDTDSPSAIQVVPTDGNRVEKEVRFCGSGLVFACQTPAKVGVYQAQTVPIAGHTGESLLPRTNEREVIISEKTHVGSSGGIQSASKDAARPNAADEVLPTFPLAPTLAPVIAIKEKADANATPGTYLDDGGKEIVKALEAIPIGSAIAFASEDLGVLLLADAPIVRGTEAYRQVKHLAQACNCSVSLQEKTDTITFYRNETAIKHVANEDWSRPAAKVN